MNTRGLGAVLLVLFSIGIAAQEKPSEAISAQVPGDQPHGQLQAAFLSLDFAVGEALAKNPAVQSALHNIKAQRRRVPQVKTLCPIR